MSEEEKQAIEWLKEELEDEKKHHNHIYKGILGLYDNGSIEIILNLIEKQQKEIEELNNKKAENYYHWKHLEANIINKIQELESHVWNDGYMTKFDKYAIHYLKELLGE